MSMTDTTVHSPPDSPSAAPVPGRVVSAFAQAAAQADSDTAAGTDMEGTNHSTASYADSLHRAASARPKQPPDVSCWRATGPWRQVQEDAEPQVVSEWLAGGPLCPGGVWRLWDCRRQVLEAAGWGSGAHICCSQEGTVSPCGPGLFDEASAHQGDQAAAVGERQPMNHTVHGGTKYAADKAAAGHSKDLFYQG